MVKSKKRSSNDNRKSTTATAATPSSSAEKKSQRTLTSLWASSSATTTTRSSTRTTTKRAAVASPAVAPLIPVSSRSSDDNNDDEEKDDDDDDDDDDKDDSSASYQEDDDDEDDDDDDGMDFDDDDDDDFEVAGKTTTKAKRKTAVTRNAAAAAASSSSSTRRTTTRTASTFVRSNPKKASPPPPTTTSTGRKKRAPPEEKSSDDADDEDDDDDESNDQKKTKTAKRAKTTSSLSSKKKSKETTKDEFTKKLKKDRASYKPNNNPQKWPSHDYVDPVGLDPTHGIVESILTRQVSKIGKLLWYNNTFNATNPIRLQTACSGTDAPSIALGMVHEILHRNYVPGNASCSGTTTDRPGGGNNDDDDETTTSTISPHGGGFYYSHEMSCEMEPFKQAYIARNFPGVTLFPDICKLTTTTTAATTAKNNGVIDDSTRAGTTTVLDVYGRPQSIPTGNLFVAGTSCKDFSMLKTTYRLDIEDKGTSGETFLAAVDFLQQQQPSIAIFENVDGAPWEKMQEYITGCCQLGYRNDSKAIKGGGDNADTALKFSIQGDAYVAEAVPRQVGIQAGASVQGFIRGTDTTHPVIAMQPHQNVKPKDKNGLFTLGELAKLHGIDLEHDTLVMRQTVRYCTHLCKLDTKDYGLPQTRNRKEILDHLKTDLLYSMDAFLLPDTNDRIRCFREALRSGPGLLVKRERAKELDFWDWDLAHVKDLTLHLVYREKNGIQERSRWLTEWNTRGRKLLAPGLWPELFDCWNMRRLDMVDCFSGAAIRDAISRDPLHHSFTWDLSQNVTRAPFRSATCGVSGCVTPGGELLLPNKGRTVMGYEKLLLQGIPYSRLLLGPETEVQLSDLAGNAMSVPVVSATMLAAICAREWKRQKSMDKSAKLTDFAWQQKYDRVGGIVLAERGDLGERKLKTKDYMHECVTALQNLSRDAYRSSVLCTCESSGTTSSEPHVFECLQCGLSVCHKCSSRYQLSSHVLRECCKVCGANGTRPDPHVFERTLRCTVPASLCLGEGWEEVLKDGTGLESYSFQLQNIVRDCGHWQLLFGAWEDHGSGRQVAEIRIVVGRIATLDAETGVAAYIRCFAPAIRHDNPARGKLKDSARMIVGPSGVPRWEVPAKSSNGELTLIGSDEVASQRVLVGLTDVAAKSLSSHDVKKSFRPPTESRNPLTKYHSKWKKWPGTIAVTGDNSNRVNGIYRKMSCTHTVVLSALWRREGSSELSMYLFLRPDVLRTKLDVAVFSPTPSYADQKEICELRDWIPENALSQSTYKTKARFLHWEVTPAILSVDVPPPNMSFVAQNEPFQERIRRLPPTTSVPPILCEVDGLSSGAIKSLVEYCENTDRKQVVSIDLFGKSCTRNARRLSIIAAPSLLKFAAENKLPLTLSEWYTLPTSESWGHCKQHVPPRPVEKWQKRTDRDGSMERVYDPEESNEYYHLLLNRPRAFQVEADKAEHKLVISMDPRVVAHQAAAQLGGEKCSSLNVEYCLSEVSSMGEPPTKEFHVPNSDHYPETHVDGLVLPLYPRQAKALSRMIAVENGEVLFSEEERSEAVLPGVGWCLIARASKHTPLRGGVLGDAIGSGKTAVTIALILAQVEEARKQQNTAMKRSGATLVVVPPGLVEQWDDERRKFTKDRLKCLKIDCTSTLKKYSVQDMCTADVVIVPAGLIEEGNAKVRPYTDLISSKGRMGGESAVSIPPAPTHFSIREAPSIEGTWVRNMASGPDIYVGNRGTQKGRDLQAYYGYCYSEAIAKLREKTFAPSEKGVPIEYYEWERVIIDECHETLVTGKGFETKEADFTAKARKGAREFLGVAQTDTSKRPLLAAKGVWGLTGTPLLETEARVTELANLMGGTYLTGAANHWRKEERESGRDLFLNQQGAFRSREYRCAVQQSCHSYVKEACQRNRGEELLVKLIRTQHVVKMTDQDGEAFVSATSDISSGTFEISPDQLGEKAGDVLGLTSSSRVRQKALVESIHAILTVEPTTKIIVFAHVTFGGYRSAMEGLQSSRTEFCHVSDDSSVKEQNEIISWFRHVDVTCEEKQRPRILLLSFEQAAGHNLQEACHNVILYDPYYTGTDAVADASVEMQATGRVFRQGQKFDVTETRLVLRGPHNERCLDDWIVERNTDKETLQKVTSNYD